MLGVTDVRPRKVVGTTIFKEPGRTVSGLMERLRIRITVSELQHADGTLNLKLIQRRKQRHGH